MGGAGQVVCRECGSEYADSEPACPKCGEPFRLTSMSARPVEAGEPVATGRVTRLGRPNREFHRAVSIQLRIPPLLVAAVLFLLLAAGYLVLRLLWGLLAGK